jgi:hypothetical protein
MNLFDIMGLVSTVALALPVIALILSKLAWYRSFPALFVYYLLVLTYTAILMGYIEAGRDYRYFLGVLSNFLDTPLILLFLLYFSKTIYFWKKLQITAFVFVVFELIVIAMYGFNTKATTIVLAPGMILTLVISLLFFIHQVKISVVYHKAAGKAVMISAVLFAYVGYCFVYVVFYLMQPVYKEDAQLVYFMITIVSSPAMCVGILLEKSRVKQLVELKTTREELKAIYQEEREGSKMTAPKEAVILNFDKKQWS